MGQQAPKPPLEEWDHPGDRSWAETHTLTHGRVAEGPPSPSVQRKAGQCLSHSSSGESVRQHRSCLVFLGSGRGWALDLGLQSWSKGIRCGAGGR